MELQIRELKQKDVYRLSKILKKLSLKDHVQELYQNVTGKGKKEKDEISVAVGLKFALLFAENMHLAEKEVDEFLGSLVDMSAADFSDLPVKQSFSIIKQLFTQEDILDFFRMASDQMK